MGEARTFVSMKHVCLIVPIVLNEYISILHTAYSNKLYFLVYIIITALLYCIFYMSVGSLNNFVGFERGNVTHFY